MFREKSEREKKNLKSFLGTLKGVKMINCSRMGDVLSDSVTPPLEMLFKRTWKKGALEKGM